MSDGGAAMFKAPARAYDRFVGRYGEALASGLMEMAGIASGHRVLDVGCGPGVLTRALAGTLGSDHVAAVDPSPVFIAACRDRVPGADVRQAAAEELPFEDDAFDASLAQLVVNFMADPHAGVGEMRRVTRPGGVVGAAVWDYSGAMKLLRDFWDSASALDASAADRDEGRCMPYCSRDELHGLWESVGLMDIQTSALDVDAGYDDFYDLWSPLEAGVGPAGAYAKSLPDDARARLRDELQRRLGVGAEPFRLPARAWAVVGRVP